MAVTGIFASNQGIIGERQGDFASGLLMINPTGSSLLLGLTSGMGKAEAADTVFTWFEDSHASGRAIAVSGGVTTTVVVDDGSFYAPNTVLLVENTGEMMLVTSVTGNTLTVIRGLSGTAVVSIAAAMGIQNVGNAAEEGSGLPSAVTQQGTPRMNYTQIFRNGWAITGTATAVKYLTGSKLALNKRMCAIYHGEDQERAMLWSKKHIGMRNGKQFRMSDGIVTQIEQFGGTVVSAATGGTAGNYSRKDFEDFVRRIFARNVKGQPNERIAIGGDLVLAALNQMTMLDGTYQIGAGEMVLGIMVTTIQTAFGKLKLMTHPLMNENPTWQKELYVLHPGGIRRRMLRDTFPDDYDVNGTRINGVDAQQGAMTTEVGFECGGAKTMGILRNVGNAVKST